MKKILFIVFELIILQLIRISYKFLIFRFVEKTVFLDTLFSAIFMLLIIFIFVIFIKKKKLKLNIFPEKFNWKYILSTIMLLIFFVVTPIITKNNSVKYIIRLIYNAVVTVIFEETIFRGYVYKEISNIKNERIGYIISTILFGIWHLGYIDTIMWRITVFSTNTILLNIMFWKVITGLVIGVVLGFLRYKNKNVYSSMMLHSFINIIGS